MYIFYLFRQQSLQIYSCFNLLALVLYDHVIRTRSHALALQDAVRSVNELFSLFDVFCATVFVEGKILYIFPCNSMITIILFTVKC